jgi:microcystin-dependent protein
MNRWRWLVLVVLVVLVAVLDRASSADTPSNDTLAAIASLKRETAGLRQQLALREDPIGTVVAFAGPPDRIPQGWKLCNGEALNQQAYPDLYRTLQRTWGGSGENFNLPDLRGTFLRGVDQGRSITPSEVGRALANLESSAIQDHTHIDTGHHHSQTHLFQVSRRQYAGTGSSINAPADSDTGGQRDTESGTANLTGARPIVGAQLGVAADETRPVNVAIHWIIKVGQKVE